MKLRARHIFFHLATTAALFLAALRCAMACSYHVEQHAATAAFFNRATILPVTCRCCFMDDVVSFHQSRHIATVIAEPTGVVIARQFSAINDLYPLRFDTIRLFLDEP